MLYHTYKCTGDIECISDIAYDKHFRLFPISMILISICLFVGMFIITPNPIRWVSIIPAISIIMVGLIPYKANKKKYIVHVLFAMLSFISTLIMWILVG